MDNTLTEFLLAIAGASLALAGLASLISLFRESETYESADIYVFRTIILSCVMLSIGGLLPLALEVTFGKIDSRVWQICSLAYAISSAALIAQVLYQVLTNVTPLLFPHVSYTLMAVAAILVLVNFVNVVWWKDDAAYVWGLMWALVSVGFRLYLFLVFVTMPMVEEKPLPDD
jgi:hypothetical protein